MTKHVTGMKRNQIIQRWLQGIDDEEYEVFPTKKEGKYIVKQRKQPLIRRDKSSDNLNEMADSSGNSGGNLTDNCISNAAAGLAGNSMFVQPTITPPRQRETQHTYHDSTINLEILEQLRSLGEEMRSNRFKKEQKQYIKHVINKELTKSRIKSRYVPDMFPTDDDPPQQPHISNPAPEPTPEPEPEPEPTPQFRSRIRRH